MAVLFSDNFNRADSASLGSNWTEGTGSQVWDILSNALRATSRVAGPATCTTVTAAHPDTADVHVTVTQVDVAGDGGPIARCTDTSQTPTMYFIDMSGGVLAIYRHNASTNGTLIDSTSVTQVANGVCRLDTEGVGGTVTLRKWYNGTQRGSDFLDTSASRLVTAGRTGVGAWAVGADGDYDDFIAEDTVVAGGHRLLRLGVG